MGWEVTAGFSVIILATILLPKYLGGAFTTLPEFINTRFDHQTRLLIVVLFMVGYGFITIPSVLYSGSLAVIQILIYRICLTLRMNNQSGLSFG